MEAADSDQMRREVRGLLNRLTCENVDIIVEKVCGLGIEDPANGRLDELVTSLVQYSYGARRYFAVWGQLVSKVVAHFPNLDITTRILKRFRMRMHDDLVASVEDGADAQMTSEEIRNQLVIGLRMIGDLFNAGSCSAHDIGCFLRLIGFLDYGDVGPVLSQSSAEGNEERVLPKCSFISGRLPAEQPKHGDNVQSWRERMGAELGLPGARIGLLQLDGTRLPLHVRFSDFDSDTYFQIMILSPALKEEHRIEAVCEMLQKVALQLDVTDDGRTLKVDLLQSLEQLRPTVSKRFQFIIEDTKKICAPP